MNTHIQIQRSKIILLVTGAFFVSIILSTHTAFAVGSAANAACVGIDVTCPCNSRMVNGKCKPGLPNNHMCQVGSCLDETNNLKVLGQCDVPGHCKAVTAPGLDGKPVGVDTGLGQLGQMLTPLLKDLLGKLMEGGKGGGDSGGGAGTGNTVPQTTCTSYHQVSTPSADPCAYYVPGSTNATSSANDSTSQDLLNALNGGNTSGANTTNQLNTALGQNASSTTNSNSDVNTNTNLNTDLTTVANPTGTFVIPGAASSAPNGLSGGIQTTGNGATFVADHRDVQGNTETSSFFGADTIGGTVHNLILGMCRSRPWTRGFLSVIIPPAFFDSLCTQGGFTGGTPPATASTHVSSAYTSPARVKPKPPIVQIVASSTPLVPPRVDIWAVPSSVSLGARTTIYWNTENVSHCSETSPDGSFSQTSLSGGSQTVPLTEPTIFTISCLASNQSPVTSYVTVKISH